jgi:hypothetical protein
VLRRIGQVGALAAGASSTAVADRPDSTSVTYDRLAPEDLTELFDRQAGELLYRLSTEGYLEQPRLPEDARKSRKLSDVVAEQSGAAVVNFEAADGSVTRQVFVSRETEDGKLNLFLNRDTGEAYAVSITDDGTTLYGEIPGTTGSCSSECLLNEVCQQDPYKALYKVKEDTLSGCATVDYRCLCDIPF